MLVRLACCLLFAVVLGACGGADAPGVGLAVATYGTAAQQQPTRVPALVTDLREMNTQAFRSAFERQQDYAFSRYRRTEQFSEEGLLSAFAEYTSAVAPGQPPRVVAADSAGAFDYGLFARFVSANVTAPDPVDLSDHVLPEDPVYLQDRHLEAYAFRAAGDTLLWDRTARVIEVEARPDLGDGYNIRRVRYMIDRETDQLLAVELDRIDLALLYREESSFFLHVRPTAGGELLPYTSRFYSAVWMPFQEVKRIGTVATYYDYDRTTL